MDWCRVADQGCHRGITPGRGLLTAILLMSPPVAVVVLTACCLVVLTARSSASPPATHTLDDVNQRLDIILNNTRSRENYIRCFMDRGICNKDALSIKRILTAALAANCSNCTQSQRVGAERFFEYLKTKQPETWTSLTAKYDTRGGGDDDDDESDDSDDDDEKKGHKHPHTHGNPPPPGGSDIPPQDPGEAAGTVPANSTITMIF